MTPEPQIRPVIDPKTQAPGKGDARRPAQITDEEWAKNWERIFGRRKDPNGRDP